MHTGRRLEKKTHSQNAKRLNHLRGIEPLDARLLLSVNTVSFEIFGRDISTATITQGPDRTSFRDLNIDGYDGTPDVAATDFLEDYAGLLGLPDDVTDQLSLIDTRFGVASSHAYFEQVHDGVPVDGGLINVSMNGYGNVQTVHTSFRPLDFPEAKPLVDVTLATKQLHQSAGVHETWAEGQTELVWATLDDSPELAWRIYVHASKPEQQDLIGLVSATDGKVLRIEDRSARATGTGHVFYPNPIQTQGSATGLFDNNDQSSPALDAQTIEVTLERLDEGTGELRGDWVDVTLVGGLTNPADEADRVYDFDRDDDHFEEVVLYYTIDQVQEYIHSLGYDDDEGTENGIRDFPTQANAHWNNDRNAFYSVADDSIHFGDANGDVDLAEDGDIIVHEYGHAIQHDQNPNWGGGEMGAMGEGFSDYLAASFFADIGDPDYLDEHAPSVAEWGFVSEGLDFLGLRRVDGDKMYPDDLVGAVHADGEIWSAALWDIRSQLGRTTTDQIVLESHFELPAGSSMVDAAFAILTADANLNGGVNADAIRSSFEDRTILRAPDDHGNIATDATLITVPSTTSAVVDYTDDRDFFEFAAIEGTTYEFQTSVDSPADTTLTLYDTNGATRLGFNNNSGAGDASRILWTAPDNQSYFVQVSGPNQGDAYEFTAGTIETPADDHGNDVDSATAVANPSATTGLLEVASDVDVFAFPATTGEIYALNLELGSLEQGEITITDSAGNILDTSSGGDAADTIFFPVTTDTYYARVTGDAQGSFQLSIDELADDHSNISATATAVPVPGNVDGDLEYLSDQDMFSVDLTNGASYLFDVELNSLGDSVLELIDTDGVTVIEFDDDGGDSTASRIAWQATGSGTYFLRVGAFADSGTGTYTLTVATDDHSNSTNSASGLSTGSGQAVIDYLGDQDFFRFRASAGRTYQLQVDANLQGDGRLALHDTSGQQLAFSDRGFINEAETILWTAPSTGTYFMSLSGTQADGEPYTVGVMTTDTPTDDFGNTIDAAELVTLSSSTPGELEVVGDADAFEFELTGGTTFQVETFHDDANSSQIEVWDESGPIQTGANSLAFTPGSSGRFFAIVSTDPLAGTQGAYSFSIGEVTDDHGNSSRTATRLGVPDSLDGWIEDNGDIDMFSFSATSGESYEFEVFLNSLSDSTLTLFDSDGRTQLSFDDDGGFGLGSRITWTARRTGNVFLQVSGFGFNDTGTYELAASLDSGGTGGGDDDHGNSAGSATPIDANSTVNGAIDDLFDIDYFAFTVGESSEVVLETQLVTLFDSTLRLFDQDGVTELAFNDDGGRGLASRITWTAPSAGTYFAEVAGFFGDIGTYRLEISSTITSLPCDYVDVGNGCNIDDLDALYAGTDGAPSPLTNELIDQWLIDASAATNPLKPNAGSLFVHGDINLDGLVDSTDLGLLLNNFGDDTGLGWGSGNLNSDASVDSTDLGLLLNNFGHTSQFKSTTIDVNKDGIVNPLDSLVQINLFNADDDEDDDK